MKKEHVFTQGSCDYFCSIYSIINGIQKMTHGTFSYKNQIYIFNRLLEKLAAIGGLKNIEQRGVSYTTALQLIKNTQKILLDKYQFKITINQPFHHQNITATHLKPYLTTKNTAIIFTISENNGMKHWSVLNKIKKDKIILNDSWVYKSIKLQDIPTPYKIDDVFIMHMQTEHTPNSQPKNRAK